VIAVGTRSAVLHAGYALLSNHTATSPHRPMKLPANRLDHGGFFH
jgi:hypothetical protein